MAEIKLNKAHFISSFLKDLSLYALEPIVSKLVSFLLIPLYTAYLLPEEFGNLQYVLSIGAFLRSFSQMGLNTAFWKFRGSHTGYDRSQVLLSLTVTQVYLSGIVIAGLCITYYAFPQDPTVSGLMLLYFAALTVKIISENVLLLSRANGDPKKYLQISLLQTFLVLGLNLFLVMVMDMNALGIVLSYLISFSIVGLLYFSDLKKAYAKVHNWKLSKEMIAFGFPVMLSNFSLLLLSLSDRWFLKNFTSDLELGWYSYTYKFADLIATFLVYTFQLAWTPLAWKVFDHENGPRYFASMKKMIYVFFPFLCLVAVFGISLIAKWMTVDASYLKAMNVMICLAFSHVFYGFYLFYNTALFYKQKQVVSLVVNVGIAVLTVGLNAFIIPTYGYYGAAWTTFFSYFILFVVIKIMASKHYVHPGNLWKELLIIGWMLLSVAAVYYCFQSNYSIYFKALMSLVAGLIYLLVVQVSGYLNFHQMKEQLSVVKSFKKMKSHD